MTSPVSPARRLLDRAAAALAPSADAFLPSSDFLVAGAVRAFPPAAPRVPALPSGVATDPSPLSAAIRGVYAAPHSATPTRIVVADPGTESPRVFPGGVATSISPPRSAAAHAVPHPAAVAPPPDYGDAFPTVAPGLESPAFRLHDFLSTRAPGIFGFAAGQTLSIVSSLTRQFLGVDLHSLLGVEQSMYRMMVPSRDGYVGGSPPIFQALADGQAAYVHLKGREEDAEHLTRLFTGLPPKTLQQLGPGTDDLAPVRQALLDRMQRGDFPAYVSVEGGKLGTLSGTDSIATESISSIARRQNALSCDFPDPTSYYRWLVTRVDSAYRRVDPWLDAVKPQLHKKIDGIKDALTPVWVDHESRDPLGYIPSQKEVRVAYDTAMDIAGGGSKPTCDTLADFADTAISLDRDLLFAVQTYWVKLLRELGPAQRQSLFDPVARSWVALNVIAPDDPDFAKVSPDTAPYIELIDKHDSGFVMERYDRSVAMREVVDHTIDGLGFEERQTMLETTMDEVRARQGAIQAREDRLRAALGPGYKGLDVDAILHDRVDIRDPNVKDALDQLRHVLGATSGRLRPMTAVHAEILRHLTLLEWVARRNVRYANPVPPLAGAISPKASEPLILGEYWKATDALPPTPLPPGPSTVEVFGKPRPGAAPLKTSILLEGGGGLGFAYVECLKQLEDAFNHGNGLVAIDEFIGTSAGAITAGLLAAGYSSSEMGNVLQELDFKRFYADYLWLAGATDPEVRGVNRSGLFTTRQMYETLRDLIAAKVHVQGRPVLFRDLPFKLKVVSTVINTDLPEDLRRQLNIGPDGQIVFSSENTPNMDVAAALCGSAAVPTFFQAPQMIVTRPEADGKGGVHMAEYRLQLADGGAVNNFAAREASDARSSKSLLTVMPAYFQAPGAHPDDPPISLSVLNFDKSALTEVDAYNRKRYGAMAPQLAEFLQKAEDGGCRRAVIGLNPAAIEEQTAPVVQGRTRAETDELLGLAHQCGLPTLSARNGAHLVRDIYPNHGYAQQVLVEKFLDTDGTFKTSWRHGPVFTMPSHEANGIGDVAVAVSAAASVATHNVKDKLFEQPE
jgi:NTE family protein